MKQIQSVSLIGLGAIGAAYGSRLHELLGGSFKVVANEERIKRYQEKGIKVNDQIYHFNYITPESAARPADLVIFAVKNAELHQAMKEVHEHIGPDTIILSLLNGISSEDEIYKACKNKHILPSMCVEIDAVRTKDEVHFSNIGKICYGGLASSIADDIEAVQDLFERTGIPYEISADIQHTMWWKFMINVGINQTSAVLKAPYAVFQKLPLAYEWMESAMLEVAAISQKNGVNLTTADVKKVWPTVNKVSPQGKTSMLQDIEAGRKTEVEYFAGTVCELGEKYHVPTPVNEQLYKIIRILEERAALES